MPKVMIVDDSLFLRQKLSNLLTGSGYETILAENGDKAVALYRQVRPDVVLMDIIMPKKDGLEALAEICAFDPGAKVVMLTALGQELAVTQATEIGAKDFVEKPVAPDQLLAVLEKVLE